MSAITPEAVARLFDRHAAALELYAGQWVRAPADVVQVAFLQLVRQKRLPDRPAAWLYRVVRNAAISASRHELRRMRHEQAAGRNDQLRLEFEPDSPLDAATAARELAALPNDDREVLIARIWGGLTFEEIAEVSGCSTSAAHRRYESALGALRKRLGVTWLKKKTILTKK
jgi:RNA polymerase sigma factor (sigma-70 family)